MGRVILDWILGALIVVILGVVALSYANGSLQSGYERGMRRAELEE